LFQVLDNKQECYKIYCEGQLVDDYQLDSLTHTWSPALYLENQNIEYAQIWCQGKTLSEVCPENLKERWKIVNEKAKTFLKIFYNAKIDLNDVCFYDSVPEKFLLDFHEIKNEITRSVFKNYERPKNYDFLKNLIFFLKRIEQNHINLQRHGVDYSNKKIRDGVSKIKGCNTKIIYNPWGTVTGRLTTEKNSFPILTLNKELRSFMKPQNDIFVELDFNAAELRVLLGLLSQSQPEEDIHTWINKNIFNNKFDREQTKKKVFSWLYNPKAKNKKLNEYLNRDKICEEYFIDNRVYTPYDRIITVDENKAVNYLIQSTSSDMLLSSAMNVAKILNNKNSFVSFCIHDSVVIDLSIKEKNLVEQLVKKFAETKFGDLKVNLSMGKDFGDMRRVL
jgi:hypothetical protein